MSNNFVQNIRIFEVLKCWNDCSLTSAVKHASACTFLIPKSGGLPTSNIKPKSDSVRAKSTPPCLPLTIEHDRTSMILAKVKVWLPDKILRDCPDCDYVTEVGVRCSLVTELSG